MQLPAAAPLALRPYQEKGRDFLVARRFALLGDSMGLGKTPQYLTAAAALPGVARVLIVAPAATLPGLAREVTRWTGSVPVVLTAKGGHALPEARFTLLAWSSAAKRLADVLAGPRFDVVVLDECQKAKNPTTKTTAAVLGAWRKVDGEWKRTPSIVGHSERVWASTGTPIPNRPIEMQPLLQMAGGLRWASRAAYGDAYCRQSNRFTPQGFDYLGARDLDGLRRRLSDEGVLLRRLPEDVPGELPTLSTAVVPLTGVREPTLASGLDADAIRSAIGEGGSVPFEDLAAYRHDIGVAKVPAVAEWVEEWLDANPDEALVVFGWHKDVIAALGDLLAAESIECFQATGDDTPAARQTMVDCFARGERRVFLGSIAACGTGLNGLHTRTTHCAFAEVAWTPGELVQAIGRVRRFGSAARHATASILVGADSLEDHVLQVIAGKLEIAADVLGDSLTGSASATVAAPSAAIAAPAPVAATPAEAEADAFTWTWTKGAGDRWLAKCPHPGNVEEWPGAEVTIASRDGKKRRVVLVERARVDAYWSAWTISDPLNNPEVRRREYIRRRFVSRGVAGVVDADPIRAEDSTHAHALREACGIMSRNDPDAASERNKIGWNKADGMLGGFLAALPLAAWDEGIVRAAQSILAKYADRQLTAYAAAIRKAS